MRNLRLGLVVIFILSGVLASRAVGASAASAPSEDLAALRPYLRKSLMWNCASVKKEFPVHVYHVEETTGAEPREVILYVKNKAWERIGKESDLSILKDYIEKRFIVVTLDFDNTPEAVSPSIDWDIHLLYRAMFGYQTPSILRAIKLEPKAVRLFILPEGYRVATDLTYWEIDKHGVYGTLEYIMKSYNEEIVPKMKGMKPAQKPSDMVDRNGKPFDYRIQMDIVYQPVEKGRCLTVAVRRRSAE